MCPSRATGGPAPAPHSPPPRPAHGPPPPRRSPARSPRPDPLLGRRSLDAHHFGRKLLPGHRRRPAASPPQLGALSGRPRGRARGLTPAGTGIIISRPEDHRTDRSTGAFGPMPARDRPAA